MGKKRANQQQLRQRTTSSQTPPPPAAHSNHSITPWPFLMALLAVIVPSAIYLAPKNLVVLSSRTTNSKTTLETRALDPLNNKKNAMNPECTLVMAPSTLPNSGWGMFTLTDRARGSPITLGDVVVPVADLLQHHADGMNLLLHDYLWQGYIAHEAIVYEGQVVYSALPGTGMLANSLPRNNVAPGRALYNGSHVHATPYAGAVTPYRNFSFYTIQPVAAGSEIFVDYGKTYFDERGERMNKNDAQQNHLKRSLSELQSIGYCLDLLQPSSDGYGAIASVDFKVDMVVTPVPVLPLTRAAVMAAHDNQHNQNQRLLLNYCYGHADSSLLLFPYSPTVHLINHDAQNANVQLQWSKTSLNTNDWLDWSVSQVMEQKRAGLVLELVAIRDIAKGEPLLLDYGASYEVAWQQHLREWKFAGVETPSYAFFDQQNEESDPSFFRTLKEQETHPYPTNLFSACMYRYEPPNEKDRSSSATTTTWKPHGVEPQHTRPCRILERYSANTNNNSNQNSYYYTVLVENRPSTHEQAVPSPHVVTGVPAEALRLADRTYTTDIYLSNAFRHELHLTDAVFPHSWKDLRAMPGESLTRSG